MKGSLLKNDGLELGVLATAKPVASGSSQPKVELAPKPGVRKISSHGMNYPSTLMTPSQAESYGVISTATVVLDEVIPPDSDLHGNPAANAGVLAEGAVIAATAAAAPTMCKVLVAGDIRANIASITDALKQAEQDIYERYTKDNNVQMEVTVKAMSSAELGDLDKHMPKNLNQFHVIIVAFSASPVYLSIVGAGGKLEKLLQKVKLFGVPEMSLYFICTDDRDAKECDDGNYVSMGTTLDMSTSRTALGVGNVEEEVVSDGLKARLGPMQLAHLQDSFAAARVLSWNESPAPAQRTLLRRHLRYLAHNKPKRRIDSNKFRCAQCTEEITLAQIKDMISAGQDMHAKGLCTNCSKGYCASCGESWGMHGICIACGAEALVLDSLLDPAERELDEQARQARSKAIAEGKVGSPVKAAALSHRKGAALVWARGSDLQQ
jgi:hypothetical protein